MTVTCRYCAAVLGTTTKQRTATTMRAVHIGRCPTLIAQRKEHR